jgi:sulfoxide reductase heme-binding subunit YedZ
MVSGDYHLPLTTYLMRFSKLQLLAHAGALFPLAWLLLDAATHHLTANPIQAVTLRTGKAALVLLVLALACTPAQMLGFRQAVKVRRALGLYAFGYVCLHLFTFVGLDYGFDFGLILTDVGSKRYVVIGFTTFLILLPLAATSFQWWQKRLGKNWKRLHRAVYVAGPLAVIHYFWQVKADVRQPLAWGAVVALLLLARVPLVRHSITHWRGRLAQRLQRPSSA